MEQETIRDGITQLENNIKLLNMRLLTMSRGDLSEYQDYINNMKKSMCEFADKLKSNLL